MSKFDIVTKTIKGFERDDGSARYVYNAEGEYLGQYQADCLSEEPGAEEMYLETFPGDKCFHVLTPEQMSGAL